MDISLDQASQKVSDFKIVLTRLLETHQQLLIKTPTLSMDYRSWSYFLLRRRTKKGIKNIKDWIYETERILEYLQTPTTKLIDGFQWEKIQRDIDRTTKKAELIIQEILLEDFAEKG